MLEHFGLIFLLLRSVQGESICYKNIGCFSDEAPFGGTLPRPLGYVPESPDEIDTKLLLFTTKNPDDFQVISPLTPSAVSVSNFKTGRKTYFIIHGFLDNGDDYWLTDMCKTILKVEDVNCFCVDWKKGALALYPQAANNIRVVGAQIAYFIGFLNSNFQYSPSNIHLIGHSLGAQTAGEAGKRIRGLGRITGLDPAGPYFLNTPQEVRLDSTDANFVDVIHTDTQSYGIVQLSGHLDFFPNGGKQMAGCNKSTVSTLLEVGGLWEGSRDVVGCNHFRSYKYYTESILTPEGFIGYPSPSYEAFKNGVGFPCPSTGCPLMGHYANRYSREKSSGQSFFLNTGAEKPFARWRYKVTITTTGTIHFLGSIRVSLLSLKSKTKEHEIVSGFLKAGDTYSSFIDVETDARPLTTVTFIWTQTIINFIPSTVGAKTISVQYGKDGKTYEFCGNDQVKAKDHQILKLCNSTTK